MDDILFKHFPPISAKQWKQKIQYLLQGEDYQNLIHINSDGISTLPFYTKEDLKKVIPSEKTPASKATFYSIVTDEIIANHKALEATKHGVKTILFAVFNPKTDLKILLQNIDCEIIFQCYFLDSNFNNQSILIEKKCTILNDCLGKLSKTGNWYTSAKADFTNINKNLSFTGNTVTINLSTFHNAGATSVQQLSYAMTQLIEYSKKTTLDPDTKIVYILSVSTDFYLEIAKIKSLRILHSLVTEAISLNPVCKIIQHKSKRNLSGLFNDLNEVNTYTERHIAILGGVDYFLSNPINFSFYAEDIPTTKNTAEQLKNSTNDIEASLINGSIYLEKLALQLTEKSVLLIKNIQKGGGYIEQLKKGTIQQKIAHNEAIETNQFLSTINSNLTENSRFQNKKSIAYPFLKFKKRKTLWQPIIEKQLRESIERPVWEKHFNL